MKVNNRYFSDESGTLLAKAQFNTTCYFAYSTIYVDDPRDLDLEQYRLDLATKTLVEIANT